MPENVKDRILAWERAHLSYPIGNRETYLNDMKDAYTGASLQKRVRDEKTGKSNRAFPLAVNYCQTIVNKLNSLMWGQYETKSDSHVISWRVPSVKEDWGSVTWEPRAEAVLHLLDHVCWEANQGNRIFYNWGLDACIYGTGVLGVRYDLLAQEIYLDPIPARDFHCIWNSDGTMAEAIVVEQISKTEAISRHGWSVSGLDIASKVFANVDPNLVERVQHWTPTSFSIYLDGKLSTGYPIANPYSWIDENSGLRPGIIPFIVLSNKPMAGDFYGYSDIEAVQDIVKELNHVMAMMGDIVSENAHPIKVLKNQRGEDEKWKLGIERTWRIFGTDADAKLLTYDGGLPNAHQYIADLQQVLEDTGCVPAVAYGRFKGTQGSSLMLQVEMMPALQVANWKRLVATDALSRLADMILTIAATPTELGPRKINEKALSMTKKDALRHQIRPVFAAMLPKDDVANVNKQISLIKNGLRSMRRALEELDEQDIDKELEAITADQKAKQDMAINQQKKDAEVQMKTGEQTMMEDNQKEAKGEYTSGD